MMRPLGMVLEREQPVTAAWEPMVLTFGKHHRHLPQHHIVAE